MFKQILLPILAVIAFIVIVGIFVQRSSSFAPSTQKIISIGTLKINVEIADTIEKRTRGLSGVASLDPTSGMLFVFESKSVNPTFWMKDMLIPLDIIWIGNGKIVRIDKNIPAPAPGTADANLKTYSAGQPIDYVLEISAGFADKNKVHVGDTVNLSAI